MLHQLFPGIPVAELVLPIGISFYTFQSLSYTIDVFRGEVNSEKNILRLALYIALFPQLVAGPIVRYTPSRGNYVTGRKPGKILSKVISRFLFGFRERSFWPMPLVRSQRDFWPESRSVGHKRSLAWRNSYTLQIYFDFSGYSDMAIGLGCVFGFHFPENFNYPYIAASVKDFWRRWHISLSSWFRDYLYIPLGGNRGSKASISVTFSLSGA